MDQGAFSDGYIWQTSQDNFYLMRMALDTIFFAS